MAYKRHFSSLLAAALWLLPPAMNAQTGVLSQTPVLGESITRDGVTYKYYCTIGGSSASYPSVNITAQLNHITHGSSTIDGGMRYNANGYAWQGSDYDYKSSSEFHFATWYNAGTLQSGNSPITSSTALDKQTHDNDPSNIVGVVTSMYPLVFYPGEGTYNETYTMIGVSKFDTNLETTITVPKAGHQPSFQYSYGNCSNMLVADLVLCADKDDADAIYVAYAFSYGLTKTDGTASYFYMPVKKYSYKALEAAATETDLNDKKMINITDFNTPVEALDIYIPATTVTASSKVAYADDGSKITTQQTRTCTTASSIAILPLKYGTWTHEGTTYSTNVSIPTTKDLTIEDPDPESGFRFIGWDIYYYPTSDPNYLGVWYEGNYEWGSVYSDADKGRDDNNKLISSNGWATMDDYAYVCVIPEGGNWQIGLGWQYTISYPEYYVNFYYHIYQNSIKLSKPLPWTVDDATKEGYVFAGWKKEEYAGYEYALRAQWDVDAKGDPDQPETKGDSIPDKYQKKVTFKVKNGSWDGTDTADKIVYVTLFDPEKPTKWSETGTGYLNASQIPTGMQADQDYVSGYWDVTPSPTTAITSDAIYTYTFTKEGEMPSVPANPATPTNPNDPNDPGNGPSGGGGTGDNDGEDEEIQRYVLIPAIDGITTDPVAGYHYVSGHMDFTFTVNYADGEPQKVFATGYYSKETIELEPKILEDGTYQYTLRQVTEQWEITFGSAPDASTVGTEAVSTTKIWANGSTLHISTANEANACIYAITGALAKSMRIPAGETTETLEKGVYIVKAGFTTAKVVIR